MQEYNPREGEWSEPEPATTEKLAKALKRGNEAVVFDQGNRKARRAARARWRRSQHKKIKGKK